MTLEKQLPAADHKTTVDIHISNKPGKQRKLDK